MLDGSFLPRNRRLWAGLIPLCLFGAALVGGLITPRAYFGNSIYWLSVFWFSVVGAILIGNTNRTSRVPRFASIGLTLLIAFLVLQPPTAQWASMILYGFVGIFIGFGVRIGSFLYVETKWMYCDYCKRDYWHMKRNGVWECQRATHSVLHG